MLTCLTVLFAAIIILEDLRYKSIGWWWIGLFALASLYHFLAQSPLGHGASEALILLMAGLSFVTVISIMEYLRSSPILGLADKILLPSCMLWLNYAQAPWFLMGAGGLGVVLALAWRNLYGEAKFPFTPALLVSLGLVKVFL